MVFQLKGFFAHLADRYVVSIFDSSNDTVQFMAITPNDDVAGSKKEIDSKVIGVIAELEKRRSKGEIVTDESVIADHPELSPVLAQKLEQLNRIKAARDQAAVSESAKLPFTHQTDCNGLQLSEFGIPVRCPHCHNQIEIVIEAPFDDIVCESCGSQFSLANDMDVDQLPTATQIGHFELVERIGVGGFGTVWKAMDKNLDRTVAVKIPRHRRLNDNDIEKFFREARAAAQLQHSNIVTVHEIGRHADYIYIISDYVDGLSLSEWRRAYPPSARKAAELCSQIAEAVHYAHQQGVVHRDLKPQNIIIDDNGQPHVTDFGLAKRNAGEITMTLDGQILGTPAYMSPEQARGHAHEADARSDVYSMGVVLFELLTGERTFCGNPQMLIHQILNEEPPVPSRIDSSVPKDLETICLKCLEKEPNRRYQTMHELAVDLQRFLSDEPIDARPITQFERTIRWCRRKPAMAVAIGLAAIVVAGIVIGPAFFAYQQASFAQAQKRKDRIAAWRKYALKIKTADNAWSNGSAQAAWSALISSDPDLRGWEYDYLYAKFTRNQVNFVGHHQTVFCVAFSPDGKRIVSGGRDNRIRIWNVEQQVEMLCLDQHKDWVYSVAFSRDGKHIASGSYDKTVKLWDAASGEAKLTCQEHDDAVSCVAFSPDGELIVSSSLDKTIKVWSIKDRKEVLQFDGHQKRVNSVAFSPDGKRILSGSSDATAMIWNIENAESTLTLDASREVNSVAYSTDGKLVAGGCADNTIKIWKSDTGKEVSHLEGHSNWVYAIAFSPDGKQIVSGGFDHTVRVWDVESGDELHTLIGHTDVVTGVEFSPDGKQIVSASSDKNVKVWQLSSSSMPRAFTAHSDSVTSIEFSPNGERFVSAADDATALVWDVNESQPVAQLIGHRGAIYGVTFSPDGSQIASCSKDKTIKLWSAADGSPIQTLDGHNDSVNSVVFSPNGLQVASGGKDKTIRLWDAKNGKTVHLFTQHNDTINSVAFSPDGSRIASGGDDATVRIWSTTDGEQQAMLTGHANEINSVVFSPDGKLIASGSSGNCIKVWSIAEGREIRTLTGHTGIVYAVSFSADGKRIASGSWDGTIKVWDVESGQETLSLTGDVAHVLTVAFSRDGKRIAGGGYNNVVNVWDTCSKSQLVDTRDDAGTEKNGSN